MQDPTDEDIMVQGVTDEEKSFDSSDFGLLWFLMISVQVLIKDF